MNLIFASGLFFKFTYIFDNLMTLVYAFFVSIWALVFLELWGRRNFELAHKWDLAKIDRDHEPARSKYRMHAYKKRINPVTLKAEPFVGLKTILPRKVLSLSFIISSMLLIIGAVVGVIVYRNDFQNLYYKILFNQTLSLQGKLI